MDHLQNLFGDWRHPTRNQPAAKVTSNPCKDGSGDYFFHPPSDSAHGIWTHWHRPHADRGVSLRRRMRTFGHSGPEDQCEGPGQGPMFLGGAYRVEEAHWCE